MSTLTTLKDFDSQLIERSFIKYARINTRSDANSTTIPTTPGQVQLAKLLVKDLQELGLRGAHFEPENGYVIAELPGNTTKKVPAIGFIAHLDTADFNADKVNPQVHPHYDGNDVVLNQALNIVLSPQEFPRLKQLVGQRLITTDGTTLLGADDKAGIAALIGVVKYLLSHPEVEHGTVKLAFGPDEEIGRGAKLFPAAEFATAFAYTLDNGDIGDIKAETFNAAQAKIHITGTAVHPGDAYGLLVNAATIASEIIAALPKDEVPEKSRDHEGFYLVHNVTATVASAEIELIIRDFDVTEFKHKEDFLTAIVAQINARFETPRVTLTITPQYENIGEAIKQNPYIVNLALSVYDKLGFHSRLVPFRGGTDGNMITKLGIPTPNLFNGGDNFHGQYEYVTTEAMTTTAQTVTEIIKEAVNQAGHENNQPIDFAAFNK